MRSSLAFFVALLCLTQAYISPMRYYIFGSLRGDFQYLGGSTTVRGIQSMTYDADTMTLTYTIVSNLQTVGAVELRGPAACREFGVGVIGWRQLNTAPCIANTGPVVSTLGRGTAPTVDNNPAFQAFRGSLTLSQAEQAMLFDGELYVVMNTHLTPSPNTFVETPSIRGFLGIYSQEQYNYQLYQNGRVYILLNFGPNDGSFSNQGKSNTQSSGTGVLSFFLQDGAITNKQLTVDIFTTIATPGNYLLVCGGTSLSLNNGNTNPNPLTTTLTLTDEQVPLFLELVAEKRCYIFITSSAFPDGDLYSWLQVPSNLQSTLTGANQKTPVVSPYLARSFMFFDFGAKSLTHYTFHNITTNLITQAYFELENGTVVCNATGTLNNPNGATRTCYLNESYVPFVADGKVFLNIYTTTNPNGEVRGKMAFSGRSAGSIGASSPPVNGLAIGLGVGLGLLALVALVAAAFFFMKGRGGSKGI